MKLACLLILAAAWSAFAPTVSARIDVRVEGEVARPGMLQLADGARISDAALAAKVQRDAYLLGAAWLRPANRTAQVRLKAGILFDLDTLHRAALLHGDIVAAQTWRQWREWIGRMPVTGREPALLAPRVVEATPARNLPLAAGDTLYYPPRPATIEIVGAVARPCHESFRPLADAGAYLARCAHSDLADLDWVWVIEPDGHVSRVGVAPWNRSAPTALAPGATIYIPVSPRRAKAVDAAMNRDIARFLATQPIALHGDRP